MFHWYFVVCGGISTQPEVYWFSLVEAKTSGTLICGIATMSGIYEEVEIEDMTFDEETLTYTYPCPCGDKFSITLEELHDGEDVGLCPSCTLRIRVIYDADSLPELKEE